MICDDLFLCIPSQVMRCASKDCTRILRPLLVGPMGGLNSGTFFLLLSDFSNGLVHGKSPFVIHRVSLSKKLYSNCLVLVASRNGFERDLHKQKIACFTIELKQISIN